MSARYSLRSRTIPRTKTPEKISKSSKKRVKTSRKTVSPKPKIRSVKKSRTLKTVEKPKEKIICLYFKYDEDGIFSILNDIDWERYGQNIDESMNSSCSRKNTEYQCMHWEDILDNVGFELISNEISDLLGSEGVFDVRENAHLNSCSRKCSGRCCSKSDTMPCNLFGRHGSIMTKDLSLWSLLAPQLNKTIKEFPESTFSHIKGMLVNKIPDSSYYINPKELYTLDQKILEARRNLETSLSYGFFYKFNYRDASWGKRSSGHQIPIMVVGNRRKTTLFIFNLWTRDLSKSESDNLRNYFKKCTQIKNAKIMRIAIQTSKAICAFVTITTIFFLVNELITNSRKSDYEMKLI